ncbi:uncharacterized protein [Littorina saxatilis]|uniref:uncharacterized protein n=1 Tax=Littorina saxatilis TaxID=31220 RepID=UPI0038B5FA47
MTTFAVVLCGGSPWGFRITGGREFDEPITVSKINPNSKACNEGVKVGDVVTEINGQTTRGLSYADAQQVIKNATQQLLLRIDRGEKGPNVHLNGAVPASTAPRPHKVDTGGGGGGVGKPASRVQTAMASRPPNPHPHSYPGSYHPHTQGSQPNPGAYSQSKQGAPTSRYQGSQPQANQAAPAPFHIDSKPQPQPQPLTGKVYPHQGPHKFHPYAPKPESGERPAGSPCQEYKPQHWQGSQPQSQSFPDSNAQPHTSQGSNTQQQFYPGSNPHPQSVQGPHSQAQPYQSYNPQPQSVQGPHSQAQPYQSYNPQPQSVQSSNSQGQAFRGSNPQPQSFHGPSSPPQSVQGSNPHFQSFQGSSPKPQSFHGSTVQGESFHGLSPQDQYPQGSNPRNLQEASPPGSQQPYPPQAGPQYPTPSAWPSGPPSDTSSLWSPVGVEAEKPKYKRAISIPELSPPSSSPSHRKGSASGSVSDQSQNSLDDSNLESRWSERGPFEQRGVTSPDMWSKRPTMPTASPKPQRHSIKPLALFQTQPASGFGNQTQPASGFGIQTQPISGFGTQGSRPSPQSQSHHTWGRGAGVGGGSVSPQGGANARGMNLFRRQQEKLAQLGADVQEISVNQGGYAPRPYEPPQAYSAQSSPGGVGPFARSLSVDEGRNVPIIVQTSAPRPFRPQPHRPRRNSENADSFYHVRAAHEQAPEPQQTHFPPWSQPPQEPSHGGRNFAVGSYATLPAKSSSSSSQQQQQAPRLHPHHQQQQQQPPPATSSGGGGSAVPVSQPLSVDADQPINDFDYHIYSTLPTIKPLRSTGRRGPLDLPELEREKKFQDFSKPLWTNTEPSHPSGDDSHSDNENAVSSSDSRDTIIARSDDTRSSHTDSTTKEKRSEPKMIPVRVVHEDGGRSHRANRSPAEFESMEQPWGKRVVEGAADSFTHAPSEPFTSSHEKPPDYQVNGLKSPSFTSSKRGVWSPGVGALSPSSVKSEPVGKSFDASSPPESSLKNIPAVWKPGGSGGGAKKEFRPVRLNTNAKPAERKASQDSLPKSDYFCPSQDSLPKSDYFCPSQDSLPKSDYFCPSQDSLPKSDYFCPSQDSLPKSQKGCWSETCVCPSQDSLPKPEESYAWQPRRTSSTSDSLDGTHLPTASLKYTPMTTATTTLVSPDTKPAMSRAGSRGQRMGDHSGTNGSGGDGVFHGHKDDGEIHLPSTQSPYITLLQKSRENETQGDLNFNHIGSKKPIMVSSEGHIPRGAQYLGEKVTVDGNQQHTDTFYSMPTEEKTITTKTVEHKPVVYEGIGPVDTEGVPLAFRKNVTEENQHDWYKQMYKSLHRTDKKEEENKYRPTYKFPDDISDTKSEEDFNPYRPSYERTVKSKAADDSGYRSEPEGRHTKDLFRRHRSTSEREPREPRRNFSSGYWAPASVRSKIDVYRVQPRSIVDYEPGFSSIAFQETKTRPRSYSAHSLRERKRKKQRGTIRHRRCTGITSTPLLTYISQAGDTGKYQSSVITAPGDATLRKLFSFRVRRQHCKENIVSVRRLCHTSVVAQVLTEVVGQAHGRRLCSTSVVVQVVTEVVGQAHGRRLCPTSVVAQVVTEVVGQAHGRRLCPTSVVAQVLTEVVGQAHGRRQCPTSVVAQVLTEVVGQAHGRRRQCPTSVVAQVLTEVVGQAHGRRQCPTSVVAQVLTEVVGQAHGRRQCPTSVVAQVLTEVVGQAHGRRQCPTSVVAQVLTEVVGQAHGRRQCPTSVVAQVVTEVVGQAHGRRLCPTSVVAQVVTEVVGQAHGRRLCPTSVVEQVVTEVVGQAHGRAREGEKTLNCRAPPVFPPCPPPSSSRHAPFFDWQREEQGGWLFTRPDFLARDATEHET